MRDILKIKDEDACHHRNPVIVTKPDDSVGCSLANGIPSDFRKDSRVLRNLHAVRGSVRTS